VPTLAGYVPLANHGLELGRPKWMVEKARRLVEKHRESIEKVHKYPEIVIAAGTDSTGNMVEELELLVDNGFSEMQTILCATRNSAKTLDIEERVGTIEDNKQADILIVKGNPLENITNLRQIADIIKNGKSINQ
jgi:imidazolonepropionase-like amidohydrolase